MTTPKSDQTRIRCKKRDKIPGSGKLCHVCVNTCNKCGAKTKSSGRLCGDCERIYQREYKRRNKARQLNQQREYRERLDPEKKYFRELKKDLRKKGLTLEQYEALLKAQDYRCPACLRTATEAGGWGTRLHVDHDHETGKIRGLLCNSCNSALGRVRDDPQVLRNLADYLEKPANSERLLANP